MSAAWINIPSRFNRARSFDRIFCGPADWMVKPNLWIHRIEFNSFSIILFRSMQLIINKLSTIVSAYQKKILSEQHGNKLKVILSVKSKDKCHQLLFYCFFSLRLFCAGISHQHEQCMGFNEYWSYSMLWKYFSWPTDGNELKIFAWNVSFYCWLVFFVKLFRFEYINETSILVSIDDQQVWGLSKARELLKLNRLTILFEN